MGIGRIAIENGARALERPLVEARARRGLPALHRAECRPNLRDSVLGVHVSDHDDRQILRDVVIAIEPLDQGRRDPGKLVLVDRQG